MMKKIKPREILRKKYSEQIQENLEKKGVDFFAPSAMGGTLNIDSGYLVLPKDITDCNSKILGEHLNAYTQQKVYMRTLLGVAEMELDEAQREFNLASKDIYAMLTQKKVSETSKEKEISTHSGVAHIFEKVREKRNTVRLLTLNIQSLEDIIFMISREVSRRVGDFAEENRGYNVKQKELTSMKR